MRILEGQEGLTHADHAQSNVSNSRLGSALVREGESAASARHYHISRTTLEDVDECFLKEWKSLHDFHSPNYPMTDPDWIKGDQDISAPGSTIVYSLHSLGRLRGVAVTARREWPIKWYFGDFVVATLPLTRLKFMGGQDLPEDAEAHDLLFAELASAGADAIHVDGVPLDSFLWRYLQTSETIRKNFSRYEPDKPAPRPFLRIEGSFEDYLQKFSRKHRVELSRRVRRLNETTFGEMRFVRYESEDQLPEFLEHAITISRKTYQWRLHNRGLSDTEMVRTRLSQDARCGWLRSYVLFLGDHPCAFRAAYQYRDRFLSYEIGFDPEFARYSAGTVLQYLTIQDLFQYRRPTLFDFQDYGKYMADWATHNPLQGRLLLLKPGAYSHVVKIGHQSCQVLSRGASTFLEKLNLKSYFKQRIRNRAPKESGS